MACFVCSFGRPGTSPATAVRPVVRHSSDQREQTAALPGQRRGAGYGGDGGSRRRQGLHGAVD